MRILLCIALPAWVATAACGDDGFGQGIRRPATEIADRPEIVPVAITEVFLGTDGGLEPFVELLNTGTEAQDLTGFSLQSPLDARELDFVLPPDGRTTVEGVSGVLGAGNGAELALVSADGTVHSYVAWSIDPQTRSSSLFAGAFASLAPLSSPPQVDTPYPIDRSLALVFEGSRGCALPTPGAPPTMIDDCPSSSPGTLATTEIYVGESVATWIEVFNLTGEDLPLEGVRVCFPPACAPVRAATDLVAAGGYAVLFLGFNLDQIAELEESEPERLGLRAGERFNCGQDTVCGEIPISAIQPSDEVALARPGSRSVVGEELLDYVRIGEDSNSVLEADAIDLGLWAAGAIDGTPTLSESYQRLEGIGDPGPDAWAIAPTTPGAPSAN